MGINSCGTVQTNRKRFPKSIVKKKKRTEGTMTTDAMVHSWHVLGMTEGLYTFCPLFTVVSQPVV